MCLEPKNIPKNNTKKTKNKAKTETYFRKLSKLFDLEKIKGTDIIPKNTKNKSFGIQNKK